ncbi:hypothetical protein QLL95_gp1217 [Cotonvirus japonicus]|uniref:Uncharacterized protein n=1 Tax=Cotonvirus japonicus TaxID=2811091 RepID=A0ABM7NS22_9VIRU|nr:hypothetical protein QLL95_gp1217 [Cotonvirus japonicus]BCS82906.1 hypothetical protein [Cotonvirus japonicus]
MTSLILVPYTLLAQGIYAGLIGAISTITMSACGAIKSIYNYKNEDVNLHIRRLDIERQLVIIQSILLKVTKTKNTKNTVNLKLDDLEKTHIFELIDTKPDLNNDPIKLCLMYLHESINDIHRDLSNISNKIDAHNNKWFNYWRTLNIKNFVENLESDTKILGERFDYLIKISAFLNNTQHF